MKRLVIIAGVMVVAIVVVVGTGASRRLWPSHKRPPGELTFLSYANVPGAWVHSKGRGVTVAVLDWQFDPSSSASANYVFPTSLVPGEKIGDLKAWHGSWMVEIVHAVAPEASIMPIIARSQQQRYDEIVPLGIRMAADRGAVAVSSSMGPVRLDQALRDAVEYAQARGCVFVDVHPEIVSEPGSKDRYCKSGECLEDIIRTGIVSVPAHPVKPESSRDVYSWPYDLEARYEDGWGYSNAPPFVAGVVALMRSVDSKLSPLETKRILVETSVMKDGFRVVDAAAAVRAAATSGRQE